MTRVRDNDLRRIPELFHFTDVRNVESIQQHGLYSRAALRRMGLLDTVHCGGNEWSERADELSGMDQYVHLCLRASHPMEYRAKSDGRIVASRFLRISPEVLETNGVLFSLGVSNKSGIAFSPIKDAATLIDFEVLYERTDWNDAHIRERLHVAEKCEILVPRHIPHNLIAI
jgi:hypothetical protein